MHLQKIQEESDQGAGGNNKRKNNMGMKSTFLGGECEEDDIDDEEEFMLAQAMAVMDEPEDHDGEDTQGGATSKAPSITSTNVVAKRKAGVGSTEPAPSSKRTKNAGNALPERMPVVKPQPPPTPEVALAGETPASKAKAKGKARTPQLVKDSSSGMPGKQPVPTSSTPAPPTKSARGTEKWKVLCSDVKDLDLASENGRLFQAPDKLKEKAKWNVEVAKLKTALSHVEGILSSCALSSSSKVKDQEIKTDVTSLKRLGTDKTDKRLGGDKVAEGKKFSTRCNALREILGQLKDFRTICMGLNKSGPLTSENLEKKISDIQKEWAKLEKDLVVGFPSQWIQAWVTASVQQTLGDIGSDGLSEETALALRSKLFLPEPSSLNSQSPPAPTTITAFLSSVGTV